MVGKGSRQMRSSVQPATPRGRGKSPRHRRLDQVRARFVEPFADLLDQVKAARAAGVYSFYACVDSAQGPRRRPSDRSGGKRLPRVERRPAAAPGGAASHRGVRHQPLRVPSRRRLHATSPRSGAAPGGVPRAAGGRPVRLRLPGQRRHHLGTDAARRSDRHRSLQSRLDRRRDPPLGCRRARLPAQQRPPSGSDPRARGGGPARSGDRRGYLQRRRRHRGATETCAPSPTPMAR